MNATACTHAPAPARARDELLTLRRAPFTSSAAAVRNANPSRVRLTPRQLEVLALLCQGLPNKLICRRLDISAGTVKAHISSILRELGVASRLQAVVEASNRGLIAEAQGANAQREPDRVARRVVTALEFSVHAAGKPFDRAESAS
jgi:DNA-binding CsgD family transcriptional regulator